jgi:hypothetical protein
VDLQEEYVLEHMASILTILRNSNVALRWLLLHSWGAQKKLRGAVTNAAPQGDDLLTLLLGIAELESEVSIHPSPRLHSIQHPVQVPLYLPLLAIPWINYPPPPPLLYLANPTNITGK